MKRNLHSIRAAVLAGAVFAAAGIPVVSHAGSVTLNNAAVCSSAPTMSMTPAGDLTITCTPVSTGGGTTTPTTAPACTLANQTVTVGQSATLSASCNPAATSYAWTNASTTGAPTWSNPTTGSVLVGSFDTVGAFTYSVAGTNSVGTGAASSGTVTVIPVSTGGSGTCTTSTTQFFDSTFKDITLERGTWASVKIGTPAVAAQYAVLKTIQNTASQADLKAEVAISTCPGNFNVPAGCSTWGSVWGGATSIRADAVVGAACPMDIGTTYYVNVRMVEIDRVTPSCIAQTCTMRIQRNSTVPRQ
jgi:hypothetical protein